MPVIPSTITRRNNKKPRLDTTCAGAVDVARAAVIDFAGTERVGEHIIALPNGERTAEHRFLAHEPGYRGWQWSVTVMRAARSKHVTVAEIALLPADGALLAPAWVPWSERLRPGDLGVGDLLPANADDERLVPSYVLSDDRAINEAAEEIGFGRTRVMSRTGRVLTAERWYKSDGGPEAENARNAPGPCGTCGFYLPLAGSLGGLFGACGNLFAPDDRTIVSADHGCGAHSEGS